jgi:large subunit ribosomal protein L7/L12
MLLVKKLLIAVDFFETTFDVNASISLGSFSGGSLPGPSQVEEEPVEQQTEFDVILEAVPGDKLITAIKCVRKVTGVGLKEAKDIVVGSPTVLYQAVSKEKAEETKQIFEEVGVEVIIK